MKTAATLSTDARAWRALGHFWAVVLAAAALGAATLAWLGPPEPVAPPQVATEAGPVPDAPAEATATGREAPPADPPRPAVAEAPAPTPASVPRQPPAPTPRDAPGAGQTPTLPQVVTPVAAPQPAPLPVPAMEPREPPTAPRAPDPPPRNAAQAPAPAPLAAATADTAPAAVTPTPMPEPPPAAQAAIAQAATPAPRPPTTGDTAPAAVTPAPAAPHAAAPPRPASTPPPPAAIAPGPITPPDAGLMEPSRHGPLPRIGPDGRSPARLYARAFDRSQPGPRVAVLVGGVGLSARLAEEAIARLPPEVSLALSPYAPDLAPLLTAARARGIETLMSLPFEPQGWPLNDPGDQAMLTGLPMEQNLDRLFWALSRAQGQIGVVGALGPLRGERFAAQPGALEAVQRILASRGLIYVEPRPGAPGPGFSWGVAVDLVLDDPAGAAAIDARLAALEARARERGSAIGYAGDASPVLVARVAAWAEGLARRGVVLAPVSAMIRRPEPR